jgi:hypothetical protein
MADPKVTKVRIEYEDGTARELVGVERCQPWSDLVNAQGALWMTRGWAAINIDWCVYDALGWCTSCPTTHY